MIVRVFLLVLTLALIGCDESESETPDAGAEEEPTDAGRREARPDAGSPGDAGSDAVDAGSESDAGAPPLSDAGPPASLWRLDFSASPLGAYDEDQIRDDWEGIRWANPNGRVFVEEEDGDRFIRVHYPTGGVGPGDGGAQWWVDLEPVLGRTFDELYVSYRVRFRGGFDFVRGGKLPGLMGGAGNTGGDRPTGSDGWSGRMMWRPMGLAVQYLYHPDQPSRFGEDLDWTLGGERRFAPGEWITVEHRIRMNAPGERDGIVEGWWNGEPALSRTDIRYRDVADFAIDGFYFSTFFGGSGADWAPTRDEYVDFDDFVFSAVPITH